MSGQRKPYVAGRFYPADAETCRAMIQDFRASDPIDNVVGGIVPHAGWVYSGAPAFLTWSAIAASNPETIVLLGAVHGPDRNHASVYPAGNWATPLGDLEIDSELASACGNQKPLVISAESHDYEHSIEVQTPIIRHLMPDVLLLPIAVRPGDRAPEIGRICAIQARKLGRRAVFVGSTDLTHYGPAFSYEPAGRGAAGVRWAKDVNDRQMVGLISTLSADAVVAEAEQKRNACGAGAIAATIGAVKELGDVSYRELAHTCSAEVELVGGGSRTDSVGYEAGVFIQHPS